MSVVPEAYSVPRAAAPVDLYLDGNESRGPEPGFAAAAMVGREEQIRRYPDASELRALVAARFEVEPGQVLLTAGGDDGLDRCCRLALSPGDELILPSPGFAMVERYCALAGGEVVRVPWLTERYPTDAVLAAVTPRTRAVVVTSPNNPTGGVATPADLRRLRDQVPDAWLIVDLAYAEFGDQDLTQPALELDRVVVIRTLSKAWGCAGLRVGIALGSEQTIAALAARGAPYPVSGPSLVLAAERLRTGEGRMRATVERVRTERGELEALLSEMGAEVLSSQGNFAFARVPDPVWLRDAMAGLGIAIRAFPGKPGLEDAVRITCPADPEAFARLCDALRTALAPEALLFDMDGVLADVSGSYRTAIQRTCAAFGALVGPEEIEDAKAVGNANNDWKLTRSLLAERGVDVSLEEVTAAFQALYLGSEDRPGLRELEKLLVPEEAIRRWAQRLPLAVVTGRPREEALWFLERTGLTGLFGVLVCMEDAAAKPDPAPVTTALAELGVRRAWMVGDTVDDVRAARAAAVLPLGIAPQPESLTQAGAARVWPDALGLDEVIR